MKKIFLLLFLFSLSGFSQVNFSQVDALIEAGKFQMARNLLLQDPSRSLQKFNYLGNIAGYQKDWDEAIIYYKKLVEREPSNAEYNFKYGGVLGLKALEVNKFQALGYISDIKKHLEKAARLDPQHVKSREALVKLYMQLPGIIGGSEDKSKKYAAELEKIDPVKGALARAFIFKENGEAGKAREKYQEALSIFKNKSVKANDQSLYYELGKVSAEYQIFPTVGLELLDNYITNYSFKDSDSLEWVYFYKAQIYADLKEKTEALKSIDKALTLKADFKEAQEEKQRILSL